MNQETPSHKHRSKWARLKKQLQQARADRDTATRQKEFAYLYIGEQELTADFAQWVEERADEETEPTDSLLTMLAEQAKEVAECRRLITIERQVRQVAEFGKTGLYDLLHAQSDHTTTLIKRVSELTDRVLSQKAEIVKLKQALKIAQADPTLTAQN